MKRLVLVGLIGMLLPLLGDSPTDPPFGNLWTFQYSTFLTYTVTLLTADVDAGASVACQTVARADAKVTTCLISGGTMATTPQGQIDGWPVGTYGFINMLVHQNRCDINGDGVVDIGDYRTMITVILGTATCPMASCDINRDGSVDISDLRSLANAISRRASCPQ